MRTATANSWVVYTAPMKNCPEGVRAVCEQGEWEAMELAKPGVFTLIRGGIRNEGEAEQLARGTSGAVVPRNARLLPKTWPGEVSGALAGAKPGTAG